MQVDNYSQLLAMQIIILNELPTQFVLLDVVSGTLLQTYYGLACA